jgi:hypothetical protein
VVNFGLLLALTFWPSAEYMATPPSFEAPSRPETPSRRGGTGTVAAERVARAANGEFGRRST